MFIALLLSLIHHFLVSSTNRIVNLMLIVVRSHFHNFGLNFFGGTCSSSSDRNRVCKPNQLGLHHNHLVYKTLHRTADTPIIDSLPIKPIDSMTMNHFGSRERSFILVPRIFLTTVKDTSKELSSNTNRPSPFHGRFGQ